MTTPTLTISARLLIVTFDSIHATPIASSGDLLASFWSWAIGSGCRGGAGISSGGESGKHGLVFEKEELGCISRL
jgi:hypothetical protein